MQLSFFQTTKQHLGNCCSQQDIIMPVGISFENSSLKNSFSLSSLQQTPGETTPERIVKPRQFNSLTKNRVKATAVRRSWGSTASDHREEFWSVLQANYNYIMDNNLIDKCQEVDGDLSLHTGTWTLKEFYTQFSDLYSWLNSVQETIYGKEENITDKALRARCVNKVLEKSSSLKLFNDQASQLVHLYPEVQEEVGWRTTHLNSKWDSILSILGPSDCEMCDQDTCLDIDHELKCLRSWFKIMESCLQPLDFRAKYTKTEIETKALELNIMDIDKSQLIELDDEVLKELVPQFGLRLRLKKKINELKEQVLHRDIENHGKIVGSVVKLCKRPDAKCNTANARRIANGLERRWHLLFLRSLEWQCYLESLSKRQSFRNSASSSDESDSDCYKEPASKYPRLSGKESRHRTYSSQPENCDSSEDDDCSVETSEVVMSDTAVFEAKNGIDAVDGASSSGVDTSQFTQSNKKAPNLATYYFKHEDTDSDMDRIENFSLPKTDGQTSTLDETSEEEWTYTRTETVAEVPDVTMQVDEVSRIMDVEEHIVPKTKMISEDELRMLVQKAEELVSPEKCRKTERSNSLKMSRVNKWLSMDKPDDSCDASAEEDEKESQTSEEIDVSTTTLRDSQNTSYPELNGNWCGSCSSQLDATTPNANGINFLSISESALHKMNLSPKILDRYTAVSTNSFSVNGNNSTSSTVEEISPLVTEKTSPMRRKKSKLKKKALFGKSDPHLLYSPGTNKQHRNLLIKSGSFSGYSLQKSINERHSTSDPSAVNCPHTWCEVSTTSGADSDDDSRKRMPIFKVGLKQRYLHKSEIRDESPGKCSLNATESSSLSEAWDNYQENYLSEPYSESHDSDAARRLLNFGEDYRNFIDSQSDWSALSDMSPKLKRKTLAHEQAVEESNSDEESLKQLISDSREQLRYAQDVFDHVKEGINNVTNEIEELVSNCDRHVALLSHITESSDEYKMCAGDKAVTTGLLSQWRTLRIRGAKMQEYRRLQKEIADLKNFITHLEVPDSSQFQMGESPSEDINNEIDACNKILDLIKTQSARLASLNAVVHRFTLENQDFDDFSKCTLKAEVSELYELFDNARTRTSTKLSEIENLLPAWKMLESRLEQLQKDLMEDGKTLHLLDTVLTNGQFTDQTATCVRDVAKVLSESTSYQGYPLPELFTEGGSFSDSGISDEGSEHEIGERQGRLAAIRRLVRQLEVGLSPDSKARLVMREKLSSAEEELKALQQRCRNLIVRTAAVSHPSLERLCQKEKATTAEDTKPVKPDGDDDDPGNSPDKTRWFKRLFKASLAFQLVILTFVCLSCLYEPQCCDYMNNYQWSVSPKLHFEGRPPI